MHITGVIEELSDNSFDEEGRETGIAISFVMPKKFWGLVESSIDFAHFLSFESDKEARHLSRNNLIGLDLRLVF